MPMALTRDVNTGVSATERSRLDRHGKMRMWNLIGTVRCEYLDRMLVFGEAHLRQILSACAAYYNQVRTHLALGKDAHEVTVFEIRGAVQIGPPLFARQGVNSIFSFDGLPDFRLERRARPGSRSLSHGAAITLMFS